MEAETWLRINLDIVIRNRPKGVDDASCARWALYVSDTLTILIVEFPNNIR